MLDLRRRVKCIPALEKPVATSTAANTSRLQMSSMSIAGPPRDLNTVTPSGPRESPKLLLVSCHSDTTKSAVLVLFGRLAQGVTVTSRWCVLLIVINESPESAVELGPATRKASLRVANTGSHSPLGS